MTTTLNAPPDQINGGLTLGDGTTLNVGEGGTVSGIAVEPGAVVNVNGGAASNITVNGNFNHTGQFVGGTINVNGGTVSGSAVNGTLNLKDGLITGTTVNFLGTLNLSGGTAVNTLIIDTGTGTINVSGGIIDGISFDLNGNASVSELQLNDFSSLQGPLGFDAPGFHPGIEGRYRVSLDFKHDDPSASLTLTRQTQTITIDYGQNQSVTYHYTTNKFTSVTAVQLLHENHQIELIVDVMVEREPAPAFSAQSAATLVYTAEFGSPPSATELNVLNQFTQTQFAFGQQIGVQDPSIYAFQALGVALASTATNFQNTFGPAVDGDVQFLVDAYASVFGHPGSGAQIQQFADQLDSFETLYTAAGTFGSASNIDLLARGAIYGQMLGIEHESGLGTPPPGPVFDLTPTQDTITLDQSDSAVTGTFGAADATWTPGDTITAAPGTTDQSFDIQGIGGAGIIDVTSVPGNHVSGVQNVNISANTAASGFSDQTVHGDFTANGPEGAWSGLAQLVVDSAGNQVGADNLTVGPDTAVQITDTITAATSDALTVNGSSTTTITENNLAANAGITVNGGSGTTAVSITQTESSLGFDGIVNIVDVNGASKTDAGTITNITLDGLSHFTVTFNNGNVFGPNTIIDNALTTLTLNNSDSLGDGAGLTIQNNLTTPNSTTLNLSLSHDGVNAAGAGVAVIAITDASNVYSTLHLSLGGENSSLAFSDNGLTTLDTPNGGTGALVGNPVGPSFFYDAVEAPVHFDFSGLNGPNNIQVTRHTTTSYADVYTLGNFGTDNGFFGNGFSDLSQQLLIGNEGPNLTGTTVNFGSGAYIINTLTTTVDESTSLNYVQTTANGAGLANLNTAAQWAIINIHGGGNGNTLTFQADNAEKFVNLGDLGGSTSAISGIAAGIGEALNTSAHTVVEFTFKGNTFIFDHADGSFALTAADAMVELTGIHPIAAINAAHEITFAT